MGSGSWQEVRQSSAWAYEVDMWLRVMQYAMLRKFECNRKKRGKRDLTRVQKAMDLAMGWARTRVNPVGASGNEISLATADAPPAPPPKRKSIEKNKLPLLETVLLNTKRSPELLMYLCKI